MAVYCCGLTWVTIKSFQLGVHLQCGRKQGQLQPGFHCLPPCISEVVVFDQRQITVTIPPETSLTKDNVSVTFSGTFTYKIDDSSLVFDNIADPQNTLVQRVRLAIRHALSMKSSEELASDRTGFDNSIQEELRNLERFGLKIMLAQLGEIQFDSRMAAELASVAYAKLSARSKEVQAEADARIAEKYQLASRIYGEDPVSLKLRQMELLRQVVESGKASTIIVPSDAFSAVMSQPVAAAAMRLHPDLRGVSIQ